MTKFLKRAKDKTEREIIKVLFIRKVGDKCISMPLPSLTDKKVSFLDESILFNWHVVDEYSNV